MAIMKNLIDLGLKYLVPKNYSMIEENNILGIYDTNIVVTKDENFVMGVEINGISYISLDDSKIATLFKARQNAVNSVDDNVNMKILIRRRKKQFNKNYNISNLHAKKLIDLWEGNEEVYENSYVILIETRTKSMGMGTLESFKRSVTTTENENNSVNVTYLTKLNILQNIITRITETLGDYGVKVLSAKRIINLYAEYCNGFYVNVNSRIGLLSDSYIASNVEFFKDYFTQEWNGKKKYCRYISIKAYDTEDISSLMLNNLLYLEKELNVNFYIEKLSKMKALSKITEKIKLAQDIAKPLLEQMKQEIQSDRESMQYFTFNVLVMEDSKEALNQSSNDISIIFTNQGLVNTYETINQMPVFFSFFPNKEMLNNRKRIQTTEAISTMFLIEKDISGYSKNSWGEYPLTMFKNQNKSPFLFNLHCESKQAAVGHTMILGGTGAGKTTLVSWLMLNCLKYDINILAFDKLNGLYALTNYLGGEYIDGNDENNQFALNPFSLEYSRENQNFLEDWLCQYIGIDKDDLDNTQAVSSIKNVIEQTFRILKPQKQDFNIKEINNAIEKLDNQGIKMKLEDATKSTIFNAMHDSVNMNNRFNTINMDFIENLPKEAGLIAWYILYKILYIAKNKSKGFFVFVDEFRTYAGNEKIVDRVNYIITQARKANGVIALALQDLNQMNDVPNANSIIANMGNFIIFPTDKIEIFEKYGIHLSDYEKNFLADSAPNCRKVLLKNTITKTSNIIDVNLTRLNNNLDFLSSNAEDVNLIKRLKKENPHNWRNLYIIEKNK